MSGWKGRRGKGKGNTGKRGKMERKTRKEKTRVTTAKEKPTYIISISG
jgi:hypothetical protein